MRTGRPKGSKNLPSVSIQCPTCGKVFVATASRVARGAAKHCSKGCSYQDRPKNPRKKPMVPRTCLYCSATFYALQWRVDKGYAKYCSKKCQGLDTRGEKSYRWKGGRSDENARLRNSKATELWRKSVFERDGYTCQRCGDDRGKNLNAHHMMAWADYPELRWEVDNGLTLCKTCHTDEHKRCDR